MKSTTEERLRDWVEKLRGLHGATITRPDLVQLVQDIEVALARLTSPGASDTKSDTKPEPAPVPLLLPFDQTPTAFHKMSLRDYWAAHAPITYEVAVSAYGGVPNLNDDAERATFFATWSYLRHAYAQAMWEAQRV